MKKGGRSLPQVCFIFVHFVGWRLTPYPTYGFTLVCEPVARLSAAQAGGINIMPGAGSARLSPYWPARRGFPASREFSGHSPG